MESINDSLNKIDKNIEDTICRLSYQERRGFLKDKVTVFITSPTLVDHEDLLLSQFVETINKFKNTYYVDDEQTFYTDLKEIFNDDNSKLVDLGRSNHSNIFEWVIIEISNNTKGEEESKSNTPKRSMFGSIAKKFGFGSRTGGRRSKKSKKAKKSKKSRKQRQSQRNTRRSQKNRN